MTYVLKVKPKDMPESAAKFIGWNNGIRIANKMHSRVLMFDSIPNATDMAAKLRPELNSEFLGHDYKIIVSELICEDLWEN